MPKRKNPREKTCQTGTHLQLRNEWIEHNKTNIQTNTTIKYEHASEAKDANTDEYADTHAEKHKPQINKDEDTDIYEDPTKHTNVDDGTHEGKQ